MAAGLGYWPPPGHDHDLGAVGDDDDDGDYGDDNDFFLKRPVNCNGCDGSGRHKNICSLKKWSYNDDYGQNNYDTDCDASDDVDDDHDEGHDDYDGDRNDDDDNDLHGWYEFTSSES